MQIEQTGTTGLKTAIETPRSGQYLIAFKYANGSGPVDQDNKCAVRTLFLDGKRIGPVVLPQRGQDDWSWGLSNSQFVTLSTGKHQVELRLQSENLNMDGEVNRARIASILLTQPLAWQDQQAPETETRR